MAISIAQKVYMCYLVLGRHVALSVVSTFLVLCLGGIKCMLSIDTDVELNIEKKEKKINRFSLENLVTW